MKYADSPCNDGNERPTTALSQSLSYVNVIWHQRFSVEYITKSTYRKKEKLCSHEINKNLDIYAVLNNLQKFHYVHTCAYI